MSPETLDRVPAKTRKGLIAANANKPLAKPGALQSVLKRLENKESVQAISKDLGITEYALYAFLMRNAPQEWQDIQAAKYASKIDNADAELDACTDGIQLGRARERIGLAKWQLERVSRAIYGDQVQVAVSGEALEDMLQRVSAKMLREKQVNALPADNNRSAATPVLEGVSER